MNIDNNLNHCKDTRLSEKPPEKIKEFEPLSLIKGKLGQMEIRAPCSWKKWEYVYAKDSNDLPVVQAQWKGKVMGVILGVKIP